MTNYTLTYKRTNEYGTKIYLLDKEVKKNLEHEESKTVPSKIEVFANPNPQGNTFFITVASLFGEDYFAKELPENIQLID
jgi:hypothetical protein